MPRVPPVTIATPEIGSLYQCPPSRSSPGQRTGSASARSGCRGSPSCSASTSPPARSSGSTSRPGGRSGPRRTAMSASRCRLPAAGWSPGSGAGSSGSRAPGAPAHVIASVEPGLADNRFNDAAFDPAGRLWAGTMSTVRAPGRAALYRLSGEGDVVRAIAGATISNGLDWNRDFSVLYYVDSTTQRIDAIAFDLDRGRLGARRRFAVIEPRGRAARRADRRRRGRRVARAVRRRSRAALPAGRQPGRAHPAAGHEPDEPRVRRPRPRRRSTSRRRGTGSRRSSSPGSRSPARSSGSVPACAAAPPRGPGGPIF